MPIHTKYVVGHHRTEKFFAGSSVQEEFTKQRVTIPIEPAGCTISHGVRPENESMTAVEFGR